MSARRHRPWRHPVKSSAPLRILYRSSSQADNVKAAMTGAKLAAGGKNVLVHGAATAQPALTALGVQPDRIYVDHDDRRVRVRP